MIIPIASFWRLQTLEAPRHVPVACYAPVRDKTFPLLGLLLRDRSALEAIRTNSKLSAIHTNRRRAIEQLFQPPAGAESTSLADLVIAEDEIMRGEKGLADAYVASPAVRDFVKRSLRPSGTYFRYQTESDEKLLAHAWRDCALGINYLIRVYGLGEKGRSPEIDSISNDPKSLLYRAMLHNIYGVILENDERTAPFFSTDLELGLRLLEANRRDEAGRFEPMERGENRAAYEAARRTDWQKFPYSVILVPGYGPEEPGVVLSPIGKLQIELAGKRYRKGLAPFILVSGGYVHPRQTPYCEAVEMKRSLMRDFGVPERAIIIDPHARHTTTNMRNAARLIYRYGIPFEKPGLVVTNTFQSADIASEAFRNRCQRVFGYQPFKSGKRLSVFDLEFFPQIDSLYVDPQDPLDP